MTKIDGPSGSIPQANIGQTQQASETKQVGGLTPPTQEDMAGAGQTGAAGALSRPELKTPYDFDFKACTGGMEKLQMLCDQLAVVFTDIMKTTRTSSLDLAELKLDLGLEAAAKKKAMANDMKKFAIVSFGSAVVGAGFGGEVAGKVISDLISGVGQAHAKKQDAEIDKLGAYREMAGSQKQQSDEFGRMAQEVVRNVMQKMNQMISIDAQKKLAASRSV